MSANVSADVKPRIQRPNALPEENRNPHLHTLDASSSVVKYQIITRGETEEIVVGRLKIPLPSDAHAFILRRFDTNAISVSTMLRAAFPGMSDDAEKKETSWVRSAFECAGANGAGPRRLAGVWAPLPVALYLADFYDLQDVIKPLANATPDSNTVPRRSTRSSGTSMEAAPPSPGKAKTPPAKRRRAESPSKSPSASAAKNNASLPVLSASGLPSTSSRRSVGRASASPGRLTRSSVSPARQAPLRRSLRSPKPPATVPEVDDEPVIEGPDPAQDIEEAKAIVEAVKKAAAEASAPVVVDSVTVKRGRDDADTTLTLNLHREHPEEALAVGRPIATNRRIDMTPARKAAAWGALAFSIGLGAVTFLPSFL